MLPQCFFVSLPLFCSRIIGFLQKCIIMQKKSIGALSHIHVSVLRFTKVKVCSNFVTFKVAMMILYFIKHISVYNAESCETPVSFYFIFLNAVLCCH